MLFSTTDLAENILIVLIVFGVIFSLAGANGSMRFNMLMRTLSQLVHLPIL
jgi:hypothetical protein